MKKLIVLACLLALAYGAAVPKKALSRRQLPIFSNGRIVGGSDIDIRDANYLVALEHSLYGQFCGGSILNTKFILTAAQCCASFVTIELQVRAGSSNRNKNGTVINVAKITVNPAYNPDMINNDVCVLQLAEELELSDTIGPVKLVDQEPTSGDLNVSGWGTTIEDGSPSETLKSVTVPLVDRSECDANYDDYGGIDGTMICGGGADKNACLGDGGGPVVRSGTNEQVGVVSWGVGCARPGFPGVYANVAALRTFIDGVINPPN